MEGGTVTFCVKSHEFDEIAKCLQQQLTVRAYNFGDRRFYCYVKPCAKMETNYNPNLATASSLFTPTNILIWDA